MTNIVCDVVCIASFNADLVSRVARPIAKGETVMAHSFEVQPGGKGSNAAVAASRQGAKVGVVARIGDDDFGRMALALWAQEGIDTQSVEIATNESSGVAQILVFDDGDNSIAVARGAGTGLGKANIHGSSSMITSAKVVMASNEVPLEATLAAFKIARASGVTTLLNPAPAMNLPDELLALCDVLTPNESEAQGLFDRGAEAIIVTLGSQGCAIYRPHKAVHRVDGHKMQVVDTVGAGDTFTGALATSLALGDPLVVAAQIANAAAALSVTGKGAIAAMPNLEASKNLARCLHGAC